MILEMIHEWATIAFWFFLVFILFATGLKQKAQRQRQKSRDKIELAEKFLQEGANIDELMPFAIPMMRIEREEALEELQSALFLVKASLLLRIIGSAGMFLSVVVWISADVVLRMLN